MVPKDVEDGLHRFLARLRWLFVKSVEVKQNYDGIDPNNNHVHFRGSSISLFEQTFGKVKGDSFSQTIDAMLGRKRSHPWEGKRENERYLH